MRPKRTNASTSLIVIGGGVAGLATALSASRRGARVTCLESLSIPNDVGSSAGPIRIMRRGYQERAFARFMGDAGERWRALIRDSGEHLMDVCPHISVGDANSPVICSIADALDSAGMRYTYLRAGDRVLSELGLSLAAHEIGLLEDDAGIFRTRDVAKALVRLATQAGAQIRTKTPVLGVAEAASGGVTIRLETETLTADAVVVAAGPWISELMPGQDTDELTVTRQYQSDVTPSRPTGSGVTFAWAEVDTEVVYGIANTPGGDHILGGHVAEQATVPGAPVDRNVLAASERLHVSAAAKRLGTNVRQVHTRMCHYTNAYGGRFLLRRSVPVPAAVLLSACSGHGYKFALSVGHYAASIALGEEPPMDQDVWLDQRHPSQVTIQRS